MNKNILEQWRVIEGFENYAVSDMGRVKSLNYLRTGREQILKAGLSGRKGYEYLTVGLYKKGVQKTFGVHVLVALAFPEICGRPFEGADVNHIDENHLNNRADNLNWLSHKDNINHGTHNERSAKVRTNGKLSKTVYQYDKDTHELVKEWQSVSEVHRQTGWNVGNISNCCRGLINTAYNFVWSYTHL